jgi:4'-phosphopantetheinyl transferase
VGIDLEFLNPGIDRELLARGSFTAQEQEQLSTLPSHLQLHAFFTGWTRKEAYLKACGQGLAVPLNQVEVSLLSGEPARLLRVGPDPLEHTRWFLADIRPDPGFVATLAVERDGWEVACWKWSPSQRVKRSSLAST